VKNPKSQNTRPDPIEERLRYSEERFRDIASLLPQIVFEIDSIGILTFVNENAFGVFGYSREEFDQGLNAIAMLVHVDRERAVENMVRALSGENLGGVEYTAMKKDGTLFPILIYSNRIIKDEKPVGLRGIIIDITRQKQVREELRRHREELEKLVADRTAELRESERKFREQAAVLEQKNIAMREIIEQIEMEKSRIKDDIAANVSEVLIPLIQQMNVAQESQGYLKNLRHHLEEMVSSFGRKITEKSLQLSPREIEICSMIKGGLRSKEIAQLLSVSYLTVIEHRRNIRKKLNLSGKKVNLTSYLQQL